MDGMYMHVKVYIYIHFLLFGLGKLPDFLFFLFIPLFPTLYIYIYIYIYIYMDMCVYRRLSLPIWEWPNIGME